MGIKTSWYGIDFGTTNSAAVSWTGDEANDLIEIDYGDDEGRPFPSVVAINKTNGHIITGREARTRKNELIDEYEYFSSIKSIIGKDISYSIAGKTWTPIDIASEIFKGIKEKIGKQRECEDAVVAVPVGFTADKKRNLREAARRAGIDVKMFISEPTAAYISNYPQLKIYNHVVVFDWGGGTLDVAILKIENGKVFEIATNGINIAGDDIDLKIAKRMHTVYSKSKEIYKSFDEIEKKSKDLLISASEYAKIELSEDEDTARVNISNYDTYGTVRGVIEYEDFVELIEPEINAAMNCLHETISKSGLNMANIDKILCVGGSSKLKPLKERMISEFGEEMVYYPEKVMWDIAKGASIISMTSGKYGLNQEIGVLLSDGEFQQLIPNGQPLPCKEKNISFGIVTDEKFAKFVITDSKSSNNRTFIQNIKVAAAGLYEEQFLLSCFIDEDNLFRLRIRSSRFNKEILYVWTYDKLKVYYDLDG